MVHEKFDITKQNLEPLRGIVKDVLFYKETTGYSVITLDTGKETVNVAGSLPLIYAGASVCVYGVWYDHPKYGKQFTCAYYETKPVYNAETAFSYLSSGVIRGVGIATAKKIVDKFGDETFDIIENDKIVGKIVSIEKTSPTNKIMEINYKGKRVLLPYHKDFILKLDLQNKKIEVKLIEGMI